jgi:hypothetical protein
MMGERIDSLLKKRKANPLRKERWGGVCAYGPIVLNYCSLDFFILNYNQRST